MWRQAQPAPNVVSTRQGHVPAPLQPPQCVVRHMLSGGHAHTESPARLYMFLCLAVSGRALRRRRVSSAGQHLSERRLGVTVLVRAASVGSGSTSAGTARAPLSPRLSPAADNSRQRGMAAATACDGSASAGKATGSVSPGIPPPLTRQGSLTKVPRQLGIAATAQVQKVPQSRRVCLPPLRRRVSMRSTPRRQAALADTQPLQQLLSCRGFFPVLTSQASWKGLMRLSLCKPRKQAVAVQAQARSELPPRRALLLPPTSRASSQRSLPSHEGDSLLFHDSSNRS